MRFFIFKSIIFTCRINGDSMNTEMVLVGIILFSGMTAGAVKIWLNKRKENNDSNVVDDSQA